MWSILFTDDGLNDDPNVPNRQYRAVPNRLDVQCVHEVLNGRPNDQDDDGRPSDDPNDDPNGDPNGDRRDDGVDSGRLHNLQSERGKTSSSFKTSHHQQKRKFNIPLVWTI